MRKLRSCGILLLSDDRRSFLLMRHHNRWDLPKGHLEPGETELACALRELHEETGVSADEVQIIDGFRHTETYHPRYHRLGGEVVEKTVVFFLGQLVAPSPEIRPSEHPGYEWHAWHPPHRIEERTVDSLLAAVDEFLAEDDALRKPS